MHGRAMGAVAVGVLVCSIPVVGSEVSAVDGEAAIDVEVVAVEPYFVALLADVNVYVTNPGLQSLGSVIVTGRGDLAPCGFSGPTAIAGTADGLLDPGETWQYTCAAGLTFLNPVEAVVEAITATGDPVAASARAALHWRAPFDTVVSSSATVVAPGEPVAWTVDATNVSDVTLQLRSVEALLEIAPPGSVDARPVELEFVVAGDDANGTWDPGETWRWRGSTPIEADGSFLSVSIGIVDFRGSTTGFSGASDPIAVDDGAATTSSRPATLPTTTTVRTGPSTPPGSTAQLPPTGRRTIDVWMVGLVVTVLGAVVSAGCRRRRAA